MGIQTFPGNFSARAAYFQNEAPSGAAAGDIWIDSDSTPVAWDTTTPTGFRNVIINGDFSVNQRGLSSSGTTTSNTYGLDRWLLSCSDGTSTYSVQSFDSGSTIGSTVPAYQPRQYARLVTTGQTLTSANTTLRQRIEGVRTLAGEQVTISFYARAGSGTPKVAVELQQYFGGGGSPSSSGTTYAGQVTLSTSWTRYSLTVTVPSVATKVLGTDGKDYLGLNLWTSAGSDFNARTGSLGIQSATIDFWGVQLERGSTATPFEVRPYGMELALCQRYFQSLPSAATNIAVLKGFWETTTAWRCPIYLPVTMRAAPTWGGNLNALITSSSFTTAGQFSLYNQTTAGYIGTAGSNTPTVYDATPFKVTLGVTTAATTARDYGNMNFDTVSYIGLTAEL